MKLNRLKKGGRLVYLLQHVAGGNDKDEDVKVLGVYSSYGKAKLAIVFFKKKAGFSRYPDGFSIDHYRLNKHEWRDGFLTANSLGVRCEKISEPRKANQSTAKTSVRK
ncbi:MAG: hypothetical protein WC661_18815 [Opitutaceae bacterium]|jgi:hypothetical protein